MAYNLNNPDMPSPLYVVCDGSLVKNKYKIPSNFIPRKLVPHGNIAVIICIKKITITRNWVFM